MARAPKAIQMKGPRDGTFAEITHYPDRSDAHVARPAFISVHRYKSREHWVRGIPSAFIRRYGQEITIPKTRELDPSRPKEPGRYQALAYFATRDENGIWRHDADVRTLGARAGDPVAVLNPGGSRDRARNPNRRYIVYVAETYPKGSRVPHYYVGTTATSLAVRKRQHRDGQHGRNRDVRRIWRVGRYDSRTDAERAERIYARSLRRRGFTVEGGH